MSRSILRLGEQVVLVAEGGTPEVEYALFDAGDIQLQATEPGTIREMGYSTSAKGALARLAEIGVTPELADEAAAAARIKAARYARGAAVRCVVHELGAAELFEGGTFDAATGRYQGAWLDLPALAVDLQLPGGTATMQALHLAALLRESAADAPVVLATGEVTAQRRPGERTHRRVSLGDPGAVGRALKHLEPAPDRARSDSGPARQEILERLRARTRASQAARARLAAVEAAFSALPAPSSGPLADPELWSIEQRLSRGDASGASAQLDALEHQRGRLPATAYLRARAALITGGEDPRVMAERLSALSASMPTFHELELLAAEAWAQAGDARRATAFARDVLESAAAPDPVRVRAHDLLASTSSPSFRAIVPPSSGRQPVAEAVALPPPPSTPSAMRMPQARAPSRTEMNAPSPAYRVEPLGPRRWSVPPAREVDVELVETLSLPAGAQGEQPPGPQDRPRNPREARIFCTFLARELARDLRVHHGVELRSDVEGLEVAQRYLREAVLEAHARGIDERELLRHGAFTSELVARRLAGRWADIEAQDPRRWAMLVPSASRPDEVARVWPFARAARFAAMGHKERDLVSYYLELEAASR